MLASSFILSLVALALSWWVGHRSPARSSRLTAGMIAILCISPLLFLLPKIAIELPWATEPAVGHSVPSDPGLMRFLPPIWIAGSAVLLLRLAFHHLAVAAWKKRSTCITDPTVQAALESCCQSLGMKGEIGIQQSSDISSPVVTGLFRPVILLPENHHQWSSETLEMVLLHELGHIQRRDLWSAMMAHLACALHWFNPLVWLLKRRLLSECEFACDAHVISSGTHAKTYIHALCDVAQSATTQHPSAALAMAGRASLRQRVESLLDTPAPQSSTLTVSLLFLTACTTFAIHTMRPAYKELASTERSTPAAETYSQEEINLRLSANPFPMD